jgi:hypothetical protein
VSRLLPTVMTDGTGGINEAAVGSGPKGRPLDAVNALSGGADVVGGPRKLVDSEPVAVPDVWRHLGALVRRV